MPPKRSLCVFHCENRDLVKHTCPNPEKHPETFKKWVSILRESLTILGRDPEKLHDVNIQYMKVCDRHFEKKYRTQYNRISSVAVPTLHLPKKLDSVALKDHSYSKETEEGSESKTAEESNTTDLELRLIPDRRKSMEAEQTYIVGDCNIDQDDSQISTASESSKDENKNKSTPVFSWEKGEVIVASDDFDDVECPTMGDDARMAETPADVSLYDDDPSTTIELEKHAEYYCNECHKDIAGSRYTCVQCAEWDLCGACEARGAHDAHYVLRVPRGRSYNETKAVLATIREQLLKGNHLHDSDMHTDIKEEPQDEIETEYIETDPDPLEEYISSVTQQDTTPRRKRRKSWEPNKKLPTPTRKLPTLVYDDTQPIRNANNTPETYLKPVKLQIVSGKVHTKLKRMAPEKVPVKLKSCHIDNAVRKPSVRIAPEKVAVKLKSRHNERVVIKQGASPRLLRLPPWSDPADAARALKSKLSIQLTPLEKQDSKWLPKYHLDVS